MESPKRSQGTISENELEEFKKLRVDEDDELEEVTSQQHRLANGITDDEVAYKAQLNEQNIKDDTKPTKPVGAYPAFVQQFLKESRAQGQKLSMKEAGVYWRDMTHDEKQIYIQKYQQELEEYEEKMKEWIKRNPEKEPEDRNDIELNEASEDSLITVNKVKAMLKLDTNTYKVVRSDFAKLMHKALHLLAGELVTKSIQDCRMRGKKTLGDDNLIGAIKADFRLDYLLDAQIFSEQKIQDVQVVEQKVKSGKKRKPDLEVRNTEQDVLASLKNNPGLETGMVSLADRVAARREEEELLTDPMVYNQSSNQISAKKDQKPKKDVGGGLLNFFSKK